MALPRAELAARAALDALYEDGGLTAACYDGIPASEKARLGDDGGDAAHVYGDTALDAGCKGSMGERPNHSNF